MMGLVTTVRQLARAHAPALAIAFGTFVLLLAIAYGVFGAFPMCMDEYGYWYQAELFARGTTHAVIPDDTLTPLRELYVVWHDGKAFSKYPPGFSLVLSVGSFVGAPAAINPLLAAITTLLVYVAASRLVGKPYALIAQLLLATNPFFLGYGASFFAHTLTLLLAMVVVVMLTRLSPGASDLPRRHWLVLGGVLGAFVWVRPVDALCAALFVMFVVVRAIGWKRAFVAGLWAIGPFVALVLGMMLYNHALSGRFALSTYPVLDAEFRLVTSENAGFFDNLGTLADEYVRRFVGEGRVLWTRYFLWPAGIALPLLALAAILLRAGERHWRIALLFHFAILVLLYNFHAMRSPIPTWPQYGARYWLSAYGAIAVLAVMAMREIVRRLEAGNAPRVLRAPRTGHAVVGVLVVVQLAIGASLLREYAHRFEVVFAIQRDIEATCPGKRLVGLRLPRRPQLPPFVRANDFHRNPFFDGEKLFVLGSPHPVILRAFPEYTACTYEFEPWRGE